MIGLYATRRGFLRSLGWGIAAASAPRAIRAAQASRARPNIIFLLTDDQRWDCFGFMKHPVVKTPQCDALASEAVVFANGFHAAPICQPSRAGIMLGQHISTHQCGFDRPTTWAISRDEFARSYPVLLRKAGYFTGFVGKFGFPVTDKKVPNRVFGDKKQETATQLWTKDANMPQDAFDVWNGFAGQGSYKVGDKHLTDVQGDQACAFLAEAARHPDKPFCLSVSFKAPHAPYSPAKRHLALYENVEIPRQENDTPEHHNLLPDVVKKLYRGRNGHGNHYASDMRGYYGLISGVDEAVGRIRAALKANGQDANTVIVYSSDNGYFCNSRGLVGKDLLYRESVRAPLIVLDPRLPADRRGRRAEGLASTVDFAPTLLDLAGLEAPRSMQGVSLLPLVRGQKEQVRESVFCENNFANFGPTLDDCRTDADRKALQTVRSKCVHTPQYAYIRYHECTPPVEELWDTRADPLETRNLAGDPKCAPVLADMRRRCDEYIALTRKAALPVVPPAGSPADEGKTPQNPKGRKKPRAGNK